MTLTNTERLEVALAYLERFPQRGTPLDEPMKTFIQQADDKDLIGINVYRLAQAWQANRRDLLRWVLYSTRAGIFDLAWNMHCPHCKGVSVQLGSLKDASHVEYCPNCQVNYDVGFDEQVEVTFTINPAIRQVELPESTAPYSDNGEHVHGIDLALMPEFTELFKDQRLSLRESLSVRTLTIMFTDIIGSTQLYERLGDARAYNLVRDHFDVLFEAIHTSDGGVVKTIGDAVMAAFPRPDNAMRAALIIQRDIARFNASRTPESGLIFVKIGLHMGSAITVTLNDQIDYFGSMINQAARIQSQSRSEEILLSQAVHDDPGVSDVLRDDSTITITSNSFELRGFHQPQLLYSVVRRPS